MDMKDILLRGIAEALDGLEVAFCAFDADDRTLAWNRSFLEFFPVHAGHVHKGEAYEANLRRFYGTLLDKDEMHLLERHVAEGIERHRTQKRPFEFEYGGHRVRASSMTIGPLGRVRMWRRVAASDPDPESPATIPADFDPQAASVLERLSDGVLIVDAAGRILWANRAFLKLYGLSSLDEAVGSPFALLYRNAWSEAPTAPEFLQSVETLKDKQRYVDSPFELSLPGGRWVRVTKQVGSEADECAYFVHADITGWKGPAGRTT